ncbi:cytidylate kinase, partial [Metamycoplasma alkalescens]
MILKISFRISKEISERLYMKQKRINIAIDGPSGVGKTIMAKMLAKELNYKFISSGNIYRAIAYNAIQKNIDLENESEINNAW